MWIVGLGIDLQRGVLKYTLVFARLLLLAVNMEMQSKFIVSSVTSVCSMHKLDFPRATQQLFQSSVAKATCFFVPLSGKLTTACVTWDSYSLYFSALLLSLP